jgi:hypothetical protein
MQAIYVNVLLFKLIDSGDMELIAGEPADDDDVVVAAFISESTAAELLQAA